MRRLGIVAVALALVVAAAALLASRALASPGTTERVSVDSAGTQGDGHSFYPHISTDGRYVAITSDAGNLVSGDANGTRDMFVRDRLAGVTTRVSVDSAGAEGNSDSGGARSAISADGRYVAFSSAASNLVPGDTNGAWDIFVHDRETATTERVSVDNAGIEALCGGSGVELCSSNPSISADGRYVAFVSFATNLVSGDTNGAADVFVRDRQTGTTTRVSVDSEGRQTGGGGSSSISADGRYVAFSSGATDLVPGDTNGAEDIFVHDRATGATARVSVDSAGTQGDGDSDASETAISADGRYVAFESRATNLVPSDTNGVKDVFVHDAETGATIRVSVDSTGVQGDDVSLTPTISADGRYVAFMSAASNLVPGDTNGVEDIFLHDREMATTERVSVDNAGVEGDGNSANPAISDTGRFITYWSGAANLVTGDTNGKMDVFVHDRGLTAPDLVETSVSNPPRSQNRGTSFSVTDTAKNQGAAAAAPSKTRYYLSLDTVRNAGDKSLTGTRAVPGLAPGQSSTGSKTVTIPASTILGTYYLLACADDKQVIGESNETNNCIASVGTIQVTAPDLVETAVSKPPASVKLGGSFNVTDTAKNAGTGSAGASTTRYYLSLDKTKSASDVLLTGSRAVLALNPGATSAGTVGVTVPVTTPLGTYYLLACADDLKVMNESKEGNNCRASGTTIQIVP